MKTITRSLRLLFIGCLTLQLNAQYATQNQEIKDKISLLEIKKENIEKEERNLLKQEIEAINKRTDVKELTPDQANKLKIQSAEKRALNIENKLSIVNHQIELLKRNDQYFKEEEKNQIKISINQEKKELEIKKEKSKPKKDIRTHHGLVYAFGSNNALIQGLSLSETPYQKGLSGFDEYGWAWKTRMFKNSNIIRLRYGFSFQFNKLSPKNNSYFVENQGVVSLEEFPIGLKKSKLRITNFVFPVHFEFGPSKRVDKKDYFRFAEKNKFKIGIGGFGGIRLATIQKLKYKQAGINTKDKIRRGYKTSNVVYGLSGYIGVGQISFYMKYDISPIFINQKVNQNNLSFGIRFD